MKILSIFVYFISLIYSKTYNCSQSIVYLEINEIAFYQTINYPKLMDYDNFTSSCNTKFLLTEKVNMNIKLITSITETVGQLADYGFPYSIKYFLISNDLSYNIKKFDNRTSIDSISQSGFVLFEEDDGYNCPLESISRESPFKFSDETQKIYIQSAFAENVYRNFSCIWRFSAPYGYGFKFVVEKFDVSDDTYFMIKNTTDVLLNERSARKKHAYYNSDNYLQIYLSEGALNFIVEMKFQAYITIVKKDVKKEDGNCSISYEYPYTYWSNNDVSKGMRHLSYQGYDNNIRCTYDLTIPENHIVKASYYYVDLEESVDYIRFYNDEISVVANFTYTSYWLDKNTTWEFVSDGSINSIGFLLYFEINECKCPELLPSCDDEDTELGDTMCRNMKCNITIPLCSSPTTLVAFFYDGDDILFDILQVFSNEELVLQIGSFNQHQYYFQLYVNSSNDVTIKLQTFNTLLELAFRVQTFSVSPPKVSKSIILSPEKFYYIIDTGLQELIEIKIMNSLKLINSTSEVYANLQGGIPLYNDKSLDSIIIDNQCFVNPKRFQCNMKQNSFAMYANYDFPNIPGTYPIVGVKLSRHFGGCVFDNYIYVVSEDDSETIISALANFEEECIVTILIESQTFYFITHLWTTVKDENIQIFIGTDQTKKYFEFTFVIAYNNLRENIIDCQILSAKTMEMWENTLLLSKVYVIKIPPKAPFFMKLTQGLFPLDVIQLQPSSHTIVSTPYYGTSKRNWLPELDTYLTYIVGNFTAKFTALYYHMNVEDTLYFIVDDAINAPKQFFKTGDYLFFKNQTVSLSYQCDLTNNGTFGALFFIETFED